MCVCARITKRVKKKKREKKKKKNASVKSHVASVVVYTVVVSDAETGADTKHSYIVRVYDVILFIVSCLRVFFEFWYAETVLRREDHFIIVVNFLFLRDTVADANAIVVYTSRSLWNAKKTLQDYKSYAILNANFPERYLIGSV